MQKITPSELQKIILTKTNAQIVDVRTLGEHIDFRIENSLLMPLNYINQLIVALHKRHDVYAISYNERRSKEFCSKLDSMGYRTFYLEGGLKAWNAQHFDLVSTLRKPLSVTGFLYILLHFVYLAARMLPSFRTDKRAVYRLLEKKFLAGAKPFRMEKIAVYRLLTLSQIHKNRFISVDANSKPVLNVKIKIGRYPQALSHYTRRIICAAWFYETINVNFKFVFLTNKELFENFTSVTKEKYPSEDFVTSPIPGNNFEIYRHHISTQYGHKVLSKLPINRNLWDQADTYIKNHLTGDWLGVHYRGTDLIPETEEQRAAHRKTYISRLKEVMPEHCDIYACSDQAQFIDEMYKAFPGRVFARDIQRSYDERTLHITKGYRGSQQQRNALIDILILTRTKLIYKSEVKSYKRTGGSFVLISKFLNPEIEIISLE